MEVVSLEMETAVERFISETFGHGKITAGFVVMDNELADRMEKIRVIVYPDCVIGDKYLAITSLKYARTTLFDVEGKSIWEVVRTAQMHCESVEKGFYDHFRYDF